MIIFTINHKNTIHYYYIKDSIGIIHGIKSASNQVLATYTYDAYGNIISQNDTTTNHIKYKGYYYDEEIGMYYLLSRYYYPYWKRFLTPDNYTYLDLEDISEINLFAYCNNNPVMYSDGEGTFAISTLIIGAVIGAVVSTTLSYGSDVISNFKDGFEWSDFNTFGDNWQKYVCSAVGGAVSGVFGTFGSVGMSFIGGFAGSMIDSAYTFTSAENVGYALWTSLLAGSLAGIGTAVTNKITSSYFKSQLSNASSKTQHQISVFLNNSKKVPGVNTKAYSILSKTVNVNKIAGSVMGVIVDLLGLFY